VAAAGRGRRARRRPPARVRPPRWVVRPFDELERRPPVDDDGTVCGPDRSDVVHDHVDDDHRARADHDRTAERLPVGRDHRTVDAPADVVLVGRWERDRSVPVRAAGHLDDHRGRPRAAVVDHAARDVDDHHDHDHHDDDQHDHDDHHHDDHDDADGLTSSRDD
jgi:hypothetical protein